VRKIVTVLLLFAAAGLAACEGGYNNAIDAITGEPKSVTIEDLTLTKEETTLLIGKTEQLYATIYPTTIVNYTLIWSSSNETIVSVSQEGLISGIAVGTATITVETEDSSFSASCKVTISAEPVAVTGVTLDKSSLSLDVGGDAQLTATIAPADATNQNISWTSSNKAVASVTDGGLVKAISAGSSTISVITEDGSKSASCEVIVKEPLVVNIPATPGAATVIPSDSQLSIEWQPVTGATSYQVWYSTTTNSSGAVQSGGDIAATSHTITGLNNGTTYYIWLKAKNSAGTSGFGISSSGTPQTSITAPAAPGMATVIISDSSLSLSWSAVSGATSYQVWYNTTNTTSGAVQIGGDIAATYHAIEGLNNGTTYYIWLKAKNSAGTSGFGSSSSGTPHTSITAPAAPGMATVTISESSLSLSWSAVSGATSYQVWYNTTNTTSGAVQSGGDIAATSHAIAGLNNGTTYYIWLKAKNSAGTSGFGISSSGTPQTSITAPAAPGMATVTISESSLSLSWSAVSGATSYQVWYSTTNNSSSAVQSGGDIAATSHTITGLNNSTTYYIWLKAKNSAGTSGFGISSSGTTAGGNNPPIAGAVWARSVVSGTKQTIFNAVCSDNNGNVYAVGYASGPGSTGSPLQYDFGNNSIITCKYQANGMLVKYNSAGEAQWARGVNANNPSSFSAVCTDTKGNVYAAGHLNSYGDYDFGNNVKVYADGKNFFIVKYNSDGIAQWARCVIEEYSTQSESYIYSICADSEDNVYAAGYISNPYQSVIIGSLNNYLYTKPDGQTLQDAFIIKLKSDGSVYWMKSVTSANINTLDATQFNSLCLDKDGNIYAAGIIAGINTINFSNTVSVKGTNPNNITGQGTGSYRFSLLLTKFTKDGEPIWAKSLTSGAVTSGYNCVAVDSSGNVYTTGYIYGKSGQATAVSCDFGNGIVVTPTYDFENPVLVKHDTDGKTLWVKSVASVSATVDFNSLKVDNSGNIFVAGSIPSDVTAFDFGNGITASSPSAYKSSLVVKYNSDGQAISTMLSTAQSLAIFNSIWLDNEGNLFAAGYASGIKTFDFGNNVTVTGSSVQANVLVVKYR